MIPYELELLNIGRATNFYATGVFLLHRQTGDIISVSMHIPTQVAL